LRPLEPNKNKGNRDLATVVGASLILTLLSLVCLDSDLGAILGFGIAIVTVVVLVVRIAVKRPMLRAMRLLPLAGYLLISILFLTNYTLIRDHVRWLFLSNVYKNRVLALPAPAKSELKHAEWDGWGFAGSDTTVFLAFDPTNSLVETVNMRPPVRSRALPCDVVRVRRLEDKWYAILFYTDTYWGQGDCK